MTLTDLHEPLLPIFAELADWAGWPVGARLLDAGCGSGMKAGMLGAALGHRSMLVGVDWDAEALREAQGAAQPFGVTTGWLVGDMRALPLADSSFDGVWCSAVIGALNDPGAALAECRRVLRPGGVAVVSTGMQCWAAVHSWPSALADALAAAYQRGLEAQLFAPPFNELCDELARHLRGAGFAFVAARAFLYEPPMPSPLVAELAVTPWATLRPMLAPLLDAATLAAADAHAAAPEDADLVSLLLAARGTACRAISKP